MSKEKMIVKSATGNVAIEPLTKPTKVHDPVSGLTTKIQLVISSSRPVNLLGRDGLTALNIGIKPTGTGMTAVRLTDNCFVLKDTTQCYYWYSMDPVRRGPASITADLKKEIELKTKPGNVVQPECEMHITTYYKCTPGPDKRYEDMFFKDPKYPFTVTALYWDRQGNVGAAVQGDKRLRQVFKTQHTPHICLAKTTELDWQDIGELVTRGENIPDTSWQKCHSQRKGSSFHHLVGHQVQGSQCYHLQFLLWGQCR